MPEAGILLPGNGSPRNRPPARQFTAGSVHAFDVSGSKTLMVPVSPSGTHVLNSPPRITTRGTLTFEGRGRRSRQTANEKNTKSVSLRIGPPPVPPNWCWLRKPRPPPSAQFCRVLASRIRLRQKSNRVPRQRLVPDFKVV